MVVNSQTFGSNPQSYQHSYTNPNEFISSNFNQNREISPLRQSLSAFPTQSPFIPQRNAYSPSQSSLLDKITFTNGPASIPTQSPESPQYQYTYQTLQPERTQAPILQNQNPNSALFPGQAQPSAKLFNFLNQPYQFFQNSFNRFQQGQVQESENIGEPQPQPIPSREYEYVTVPPKLVTLPPRSPSYDEENRQNFYTYYDDSRTPSRFTVGPPKSNERKLKFIYSFLIKIISKLFPS